MNSLINFKHYYNKEKNIILRHYKSTKDFRLIEQYISTLIKRILDNEAIIATYESAIHNYTDKTTESRINEDVARILWSALCKYATGSAEDVSVGSYQKSAMRTDDKMSTKRLVDMAFTLKDKVPVSIADFGGIINACLGLSGEVGEFNDLIKKWVFHEKSLDIEHAKRELGDVCWYVALVCESFGWDFDDILQININKLTARYPHGFDIDRANNRTADDI